MSAADDTTGVAIRLEGLAHRFGSRLALAGVDASIESGTLAALLGPNGSGKSTLMGVLSTVLVPDAGRAEVLGCDLGSAPAGALRAMRRRVGVVFQSEGLDGLLTVRENLRAHARLFGLGPQEARARVERVCAVVGVSDRMGDRVRTLSGGLARRVDLARALVHEPDVLLLDEPTTGLDPNARAAFRASVESIRAERDLTVLMSTHLMEEAAWSDRAVLLHEGRVVADGAPDALRAGVGSRMLTCVPSNRATADAVRGVLERGGVRSEEREGTIVAPVAEGVNSLVAELVGMGVELSVAPPTLGDVFASETGRTLETAPRSGLREGVLS